MTRIQCYPHLDKRDSYELIVLPFWQNGGPAANVSVWKNTFSLVLENGDFRGKLAETSLLYDEGRRVLLLGLGPEKECTVERLRRAYAAAARVAQAKQLQSLHLVCPVSEELGAEESLKGCAEGIFLTNYSFHLLKGEEAKKENPAVLLESIAFIGSNSSSEPLLKKWMQIICGTHLVRDLVNRNADDVNPEMLADTARSFAKSQKALEVTILDRAQLEAEKMGLLLAVNRGSDLEPYLIQLSYQGNPGSDEHIVLVGKGVTYDTGGLALKPADNMVSMKCDMAGAATVLTVVRIAAELGLKVNVTAVAPVTENSMDAKSYKMGDVYSSMNGKTVEVNNTDAEGRLILADAISYSIKHLSPTALIDVASLTGAIVVALGEDISGLYTNDDRLAQDLSNASEATGELIWRMPLHTEYKEMLKSDVADLLNSAGRAAGATTAALFLYEFAKPYRWAHLDIAGSCYVSKPKHYHTAKGTGFGVRLLVEFLEKCGNR